VLEIERQGLLSRRYVVRDDRGHTGTWVRRRFREAISGELDGLEYEFARHGRRQFALLASGSTVATADAAKRGRWVISAGASVYELRRKSAWRGERQLLKDRAVVGTIRKERRRAVGELPAELAPSLQAFVVLVVLTLWQRDTASSSGAAGAVVATGH
jgi:hypothetical protein